MPHGKISREERCGRVMRNLNDLLAQDKKAKQFFLTLSEDVQGSLIQNTNQIHNADELYFHAEQVMGQKRREIHHLAKINKILRLLWQSEDFVYETERKYKMYFRALILQKKIIPKQAVEWGIAPAEDAHCSAASGRWYVEGQSPFVYPDGRARRG